MEKMQKLVEVAQGLGWDVDMESQRGHDGNTEHYIELAQHSPAGEDFCFTVSAEDAADFVRKVCKFYFEFDPDEHVEELVVAKHNGLQGVPSVSDLIVDSEAIDAMLLELKDTLFDSFFILPATAEEIVQERVPLGKFVCVEAGKVCGIDNSDGEAWTEEFETLAECLKWLDGGSDETKNCN